MKKVQIFFIYAKECEHCQEALSNVQSAIEECQNIPCEIISFEYNNPVAINIAITKGIKGLPGIAIGKVALYEDTCTKQNIVAAIKKSYG